MRRQLLTQVATLLLTTSPVFAGGFITPNVSTSGDVQNTASGGNRLASVHGGNSYCCSFYPTAENARVVTVSTTIATSGANLTAIDRTLTNPAIASAHLATGNRLCFLPVVTGNISFTLTQVEPNPTPVEVQCDETTLFGGYNTNANPFNFLEISNLTDSTINGKVFATNFNGTVVINGSDFSVPAGRRIDLNLHDAAGPNVFGILRIVHDGPLGALQANTSFYSGPVSALELRATVPANLRDRR